MAGRGTHINKSRVVSLLDVVQDGGLVEAGEVGHVLLLVELWGVHLLDVVFGDQDPLGGLRDLDLDLVAAVLLDGGRHESGVLVGDPDEPLLGPLRLHCGVVEGIAIHDQVFKVRVGLVHVHHGAPSHSTGTTLNTKKLNSSPKSPLNK